VGELLCPPSTYQVWALSLFLLERVSDVEKNIGNFLITFTGILYEALPFIVFGAIVAGLVEELIPPKLVARIIPRNRFLAIAIGGILGLPSPMCDCGILVIVRRILRKGVPLSCCICYLLAGPIVNVVTLLSTKVAFIDQEKAVDASGHLTYQLGGTGMLALRAGLGYLVAFVTSLIVEWQYRKHGAAKLLMPIAVPVADQAKLGANDEEDKPRRSFLQRLGAIIETALHDFVDVGVFLIMGALFAALGRLLLRDQLENLSRTYPAFAIGVMMCLAVVLCICSQADAFVARSFTEVQPAPKLAFLVLGPMLDFKLYSMYTRVFRPRLIWTVVSAVVVQVFLYALITHFIWQSYAQSMAASSAGM
jgi:uncharacterized membrane protein YraQ (UPF0718 family)